MRYIKELSEDIIIKLKEIEKNSTKYRVRERINSILWSNKGLSIPNLSEMFEVNKKTIYNWFDSWETLGIEGLSDKEGKGRKRILNDEEEEKVKEFTIKHSRDLNKVRLEVKETLNEEVSKDTIKRILKRNNFDWLRVRKRVNGEPDPLEYEKKKKNC
jgi:transposase